MILLSQKKQILALRRITYEALEFAFFPTQRPNLLLIPTQRPDLDCHPELGRSVGVIFSKFLQSALFSKIHSYVAHVFEKRISSLKNDSFLTLVYQNAYIEYIHDLRN